MKKLLFTGASGFLGFNIRPILEKNYDVVREEFFGDIYFFCNDLDFGRKWKPGSVTGTDKNGNVIDIDFSTAEKLWDYLIERYWSEKDE